MLDLYDCCLRLSANVPSVGYEESRSSGADAEVETFRKHGKPVFHTIDELYVWVGKLRGSSNEK